VTRRQLLIASGLGVLFDRGLPASEPRNFSHPLSEIQGTLTAPDRFFVRDHFSPPELSLEKWKLRIEGRVARPYELSFSDLVELPTKKVEAVLECAGNVAGGSAVSNGVWEGVPISSLLESARPTSEAAFVMLEGADSGRLLPDHPSLPYSQVVPFHKCLDSSSLVAFQLNELVLPTRNGFPARALFPGWYGMDSVKWLQRIVILGAEDRDTTFHESGMDRVYNRVTGVDDTVRITRVSSVQVKSIIVWPTDGIKMPPGRHLVWGFAWTGNGTIANVSFSSDAGQTWEPAKLQAQDSIYSWVRWSRSWEAKPGDYVLMSRASDQLGQQPVQRDRMRKDAYELNWCVPLHCSVR